MFRFCSIQEPPYWLLRIVLARASDLAVARITYGEDMSGRIRERDLIIPSLRLAAQRPSGEISTVELIIELEAIFEPEGLDAEILEGRQDSRFSQKVRNLISHRAGQTSMFTRGYAEYTGDGIRITQAGRIFLTQVPDDE